MSEQRKVLRRADVIAQGLKRDVVPLRDNMEIHIQEVDADTAVRLGELANSEDKVVLARWFIASVIDPETGEREYTEEDLPLVRKMSASIVVPVGNAALALNGFGQGAKNIAKN